MAETGRRFTAEVREDDLGEVIFAALAACESERNLVLGRPEAACIDGQFDLVRLARKLLETDRA